MDDTSNDMPHMDDGRAWTVVRGADIKNPHTSCLVLTGDFMRGDGDSYHGAEFKVPLDSETTQGDLEYLARVYAYYRDEYSSVQDVNDLPEWLTEGGMASVDWTADVIDTLQNFTLIEYDAAGQGFTATLELRAV